MQASSVNALVGSAAQLGVRIGAVQAGQLLQLLDELEQWNRAYNLTRITGRAAMIAGHLLHSLAALGALSAGWQLAGVRPRQIPGIRAERCLVTLLAQPRQRGAPAVPPAG